MIRGRMTGDTVDGSALALEANGFPTTNRMTVPATAIAARPPQRNTRPPAVVDSGIVRAEAFMTGIQVAESQSTSGISGARAAKSV